MKIKFGKKQIVLLCVAIVLVGVMIAANIVLNIFSPILHQVFAGNRTDYDTEDAQTALAAGDELVQEMAEGSMVLLENKNKTLPLSADAKVNLFGWNATDQGFMLTGGGSGGTVIANENKITLTQAFEKEGLQYNKELLNDYAAVSGDDADANASAQATTLHNPSAAFYTDARMNAALEYSEIAIIVLSRFARENGGSGELVNVGSYRNGAILELTTEERAMFNAVKNTFGDSGKIIVLVNTCNNMELSFIDEFDVDAALYVGVPGQSGALAIPRLLRGKTTDKDENGNDVERFVTPSGRTADIYPYSYNPENNVNYSPTWVNAISSGSSIVYSEGIYYGYKWYETADAEGFFDEAVRGDEVGYEAVVQYPFGYGLSYTRFKWEITSEPADKTLTASGKYEVKVRVTNTGDVPGADVVQLYYTPPYTDGGIEKSEVNLLAFGKTEVLEPGSRQELTLSFSAYDLASFDDYDKNKNEFAGYELDEGSYAVTLRTNSHELADIYDAAGNRIAGKTGFTMTCAGVKFDKDPVTTEEVKPRLTGDTAYGGIPVDGTTVNGNIKYLSRAGRFQNFGEIKAYSASRSENTLYNGYNNADTSNIEFGKDAGLYLVTDVAGNKLSLKVLSGEASGVELAYNVDLMLELANYESDTWTTFLNQMTEQEIKDLIGKGGFQTLEVVSVGKPRCVDRDGPAGFNMGVTNPNTDSRWTAFPVEALIGCSWSQKLAYSMGRSQGAIANATGLRGWYGPGVNLHRSPYNSRNFEYYSEDGLLSGKLAAEVVRGAKQSNTYCYIKHFVASEAGQNPNNWYTWLTEQNLRENYLRPFEIAVKEGGANAIMSAFNRVGSEWAGRNAAVSTEILRGEWKFRGTMITDWFDAGYMDYTAGVLGGNDLWLGGTSQASARLDFSNNAVKYAARQSAKNILYTYIDTYVAAYNFAENGDPDDPYKVSVDKIDISAAPFSGLFVFLWVLIDVLIAGGIACCAVFFFISPGKKKEQDEPATE